MATAISNSNNLLPNGTKEGKLLHLLSNPLILCQAAPYLSISDILRLSATSRSFHSLVYQTPQVFRRLDLSQVKAAQFEITAIDHGGETWRNVQLDENLTEDEYKPSASKSILPYIQIQLTLLVSFYSGPIRGIFSHLSRRSVLSHVQTLILDGLAVTADLCHELIADPSGSYNVRILSILGTNNLNQHKLCATLKYACRTSRSPGTPRLKALYVMNRRSASRHELLVAPHSGRLPVAGYSQSPPLEDKGLDSLPDGPSPSNWYATHQGGERIFPVKAHIYADWAPTLQACAGIIAFDTVLCTSPRHLNSPVYDVSRAVALSAASGAVPTARALPYAVATHALGGCAACGGAPEGWVVWGTTPEPLQRGGAEEQRMREIEEDSGHRLSWEIGRFPLLLPVPRHSSNIKAAMCPPGQAVNSRTGDHGERQRADAGAGEDDAVGLARFIPRCDQCLAERYCRVCRRWWCETCFPGPVQNHFEGNGPPELVSQEPKKQQRWCKLDRDGRCWERCRSIVKSEDESDD